MTDPNSPYVHNRAGGAADGDGHTKEGEASIGGGAVEVERRCGSCGHCSTVDFRSAMDFFGVDIFFGCFLTAEAYEAVGNVGSMMKLPSS